MIEPRVLIFVQSTVASRTKTGIQRVVLETVRAMMHCAEVDFVKWDSIDGQLRFLDEADLELLRSEEEGFALASNKLCQRTNYRFGDVVGKPSATWLLIPEIPYHIPRGNEAFARIVTQCHVYGIRVAAIFYDLIPIRDPDYSDLKGVHSEYLLQLSRCDLIAAISDHARSDLLEFYREHLVGATDCLARLQRIVVAVSLGATRKAPADALAETSRSTEDRYGIVMLGTVEPRKQQTRFLRVFNDTSEKHRRLREFRIDIFGSLHPASALELHAELRRNPKIEYHQYSSDKLINQALSEACLSVFPSRYEGFGLPIVESLVRGVPCLTASFGAMEEVGKGGGCLLVDVLSDDAMAAALIEVADNPHVLEALRHEAAMRRFKSWLEYARELHSRMASVTEQFKMECNSLHELVSDAAKTAYAKGTSSFSALEENWTVTLYGAGDGTDSDLGRESLGTGGRKKWAVAYLDWAVGHWSEFHDSTLVAVARSDVIWATRPETLEALPKELKRRDIGAALPPERFVLADSGRVSEHVVASVMRLTVEAYRANQFARKERTIAELGMRLGTWLPEGGYRLSIVVSTYNRAAFVEQNVKWLLGLTSSMRSLVNVVVVDNASTDDTLPCLRKFQGIDNFMIVSNPANVGMLGNLRVCSCLLVAGHVWVIGDDDFIRRGAIERVLEVIGRNPRVPLLSHNFAVYFRTGLSSQDLPDLLHIEATPISANPSSSGPMAVRNIAEQHDNLFTAIYPLVMRSDLLASCFNYPFDGAPFENLVESVPTSKFILEVLRDTIGYWFAEVGISGNAFNSWSDHRPRWHLVLMAQVLALASEAGIDKSLVWNWMRIQLALYDDSVQVAIEANREVHLSEVVDLPEARWRYAHDIQLPVALRTYDKPSAKYWSDASGAQGGSGIAGNY